MLAGICDGRAGHHKGGAALVDALTQPPQPPQHQRRVATEHSSARQHNGISICSTPWPHIADRGGQGHMIMRAPEQPKVKSDAITFAGNRHVG